MNKRVLKDTMIIGIFTLILLTVSCLLIQYYFFNPYKKTVKTHQIQNTLSLTYNLSKKQAQEDLMYLIDTIRDHHISTINGLPESLQKQYDLELTNLSPSPTILQLYQACSRILSTLKDGHSYIDLYGTSSKYYIGDYQFNAGVLTMSLNEETLHITKINNIDIESIWTNFLTLASYENEIAASYLFESGLVKKNFLLWCGVANFSDSTIQLTYEKDGNELLLEIPYLSKSEYEVTSFAKTNSNTSGFINYTIDQTSHIAHLILNQCEYNDIYKNTLERFFSDVSANDITSIIIDLRNNPGGNSKVLDEFITYLDVNSYVPFGCNIRYGHYISYHNSDIINNKKKENPYSGKIYVLTSNYTFSSAMMFSVTLQDNHLATVVGEASSNKPSSYGDIIEFQLPNSKLLFKTTYKYFTRPDQSKDTEENQIPDYIVPADEALDKVYDLIKKGE